MRAVANAMLTTGSSPDLQRSHTALMKRIARNIAATIAALTLATSSVGAQAISIPGDGTPFGPFGKGIDATTIGQTFITPTGLNYLQSFSFWLSDDTGIDNSNPSSLLFRGYLMQWDATNGRATGPVLFSSAVNAGPTAASQRYDFNATNTLLETGVQYVAFLSSTGLMSSIGADMAIANLEGTSTGTYADGGAVFAYNGDDFDVLSSEEWGYTGFIPGYQARFDAAFTASAVSVVPEPSTYLLMFTGLSAVLLVAMKRKRI